MAGAAPRRRSAQLLHDVAEGSVVAARQPALAARRASARLRVRPRFLLLDLTTQAGTYVKEFVHGDLGRTTPNVGALLGCEADILQLDVVGLQG